MVLYKGTLNNIKWKFVIFVTSATVDQAFTKCKNVFVGLLWVDTWQDAWMRLLTGQCLTLLLLRLPLAVGVERAAPAVGQSETLLLLPALTPGRVCHRLHTGTKLSFINAVVYYCRCSKHGEINVTCKKDEVWRLSDLNSYTQHAGWKAKSISGTHYMQMDFN